MIEGQELLFQLDEDWKAEWQGMPEFSMVDQMPFLSLLVHFECLEHFQEFSKLIDQKISLEVKSIWFPKQSIKSVKDKRYASKHRNDAQHCDRCNGLSIIQGDGQEEPCPKCNILCERCNRPALNILCAVCLYE